MKVLFVAGECDPFVKTGGLGDVLGALPIYLKKHGVQVSVVIPKYEDIPVEFVNKMELIKTYTVTMSWRKQYCGVLQYKKNGINYYFIDNEFYFKRKQLYGHSDDGERFAFFNSAVVKMLREIEYKPDIIHCHDWQSAMIPVLLKYKYSSNQFYNRVSTIYTIHNLKFQGIFPKDSLGDWFNLNQELYNNNILSFNNCINFMKGAINTSDKITTVSKTYSKEIKTDFYGEQLQYVLRERDKDLQGIENGIDYEVYDPEKDEYLMENYNVNTLSVKLSNKLELQRQFGLKQDRDIPMMAIVSRLTSQKGIDILEEALKSTMAEEVQLVVLGTGDKQYEEFFLKLHEKYPQKVATIINFDNELAHRIYGGSDMFLMPSLFEPCGLGQLIALRYGTIPIVRETGGLKDTVKFYDKSNGFGNGFSFNNYSSEELNKTIKIALQYYTDKGSWNKIIANAMESENSWGKSAQEYINLYEKVLSKELNVV